MTQLKPWKLSVRKLLLIAVLVAAVAMSAYLLVLRRTPVTTVRVHDGDIEETVHGPGTVQARVPVTISTRMVGNIVQLYADQGDVVRRGQLLALLDARDLAAREAAAQHALDNAQANVTAAEAALALARANTALAESNYQRDLEVFNKHYISPAAMDATTAALRVGEAAEKNAAALLAGRRTEVHSAEADLKYAGVLLSYSRIEAPFDGVIWRRDAEIGDTVQPGTSIFQIVAPSTIWSATRIDETVVGRVAVGQSATIRLRSGEQLQGKVIRVEHESDTVTRESTVDVSLPKIPHHFKIGEETDVAIQVGQARGLVVPASAVVQQGGSEGVFVVQNGRAHFRVVMFGPSADGTVLVAAGLEKGDLIVVRPGKVRSGQRVIASQGN